MQPFTTLMRSAILAAVILAAACGSDDEASTAPPTTTSADASSNGADDETVPPSSSTTAVEEEPAPPSTIAVEPGAPTLWEHVQAVDDLSRFRDAVVVAGLKSQFEDCATPVTVFAPKNWIIEDIEETFGSGVLSSRVEDGDVDAARSFVLDHMVAGAYDNESFAGARKAEIEVETLAEKPLRIIGGDPGAARRVLLVDQFMTQPLLGCNGVLHPTSWVIGY